jgi:hypothetical protein
MERKPLTPTAPKLTFVTRVEAAARLNVSPRWLANEGKALIPFYRFGRMVRYAIEDLESWARQQKVVF